jgi:2'-5' RNA ligase
VNCFHSAVVVEVGGEGPRSLVERLMLSGQQGIQMETFLPHLTIGVLRGANDPAPLRDALIPFREVELGTQIVTEATLCVVPASQATILRSWTFVGSVALI